jgi:ketosteroid isomerase-like protein
VTVSDRSDAETVLSLYEAFNARRPQGWDDAFAEQATWREVPTGEVFEGREALRGYYERFAVAFPDGRCEDITVRAGDGFVVGEFVGRGTNTGPLVTPEGELPPSGVRIDIAFCDVHLLKDGRIIETHRYWDTAPLAAMLGGGS